MAPVRNPVYATPEQQVKLPFDADFQKSLLRLLCEDHHFSHVTGQYLEPQYFENEVLAWAFAFCKQYAESYHSFPSMRVIRHQCVALDSRVRPMYEAAIEQIAQAPLSDEKWMRDQTLDFIKRSIFVRTYQETRQLYNTGKVDDAYDLMYGRMEQLMKTSWEPADEEDFFDELARRHNERMDADPNKDSIGSGFPTLDQVLGGGLSLGEVGCWIAYSKRGKSTMLLNNALAAAMLDLRQTAYFVFEGSRQQVANRADSAFLDEFYNNIKQGVADADKYNRAWDQSQQLKGLLKLRGFADRWDYNITDISDALRVWKQNQGWEPQVIIIDYGDLLSGREKRYPNEREKQKAAFRDIKSLAVRGYAIWTAAQAQRPADGSEDKPHYIYSRNIADCYEKVRVCDFLGSLNSTNQEKNESQARIYAELYRDSPANWKFPIVFDGTKNKLYEPTQLGWQRGKVPQQHPQQQMVAPV